MRAVAPFVIACLVPLALDGCKGCGEIKGADDNGGTATDGTEPPPDIGSWLSMKPMPDGTIAIAYYDRTWDALAFAIGTLANGGISWAPEQVDSYPAENGLNPGDAGKYASLAVAQDGTAWIGYQDTSNGNLKYARRDPSNAAWTVGLADTGGGRSSRRRLLGFYRARTRGRPGHRPL